jgi:hypothetical protein
LQPFIDTLLNEVRSTPMDAVLYWNLVALHAAANDYDTSIVMSPDQPGPLTTSRAFAIIHGAMYDSMAAFNRGFKPLFQSVNISDTSNVSKSDAMKASIMEAGYQTLYASYPKQRPIFDAARTYFLQGLKSSGVPSNDIEAGITVGKSISRFIMTKRDTDGSKNTVTYTVNPAVGFHRVDPLHPKQGFLGAHWGNVTPFFLNSGSQFRSSDIIGKSPAARLAYLNSSDYMREYLEVKSIGSKISTTRTADQEEIGIFWAYDGAPRIGTPLRIYNQVSRVIFIQRNNTLEENARLFAMVNYAMFDAGVACFETKYYFDLCRPIVAIRQATSPTVADPTWEPLGAPSDGVGTDFTPNFPSYVSGHSAFGSACFEILRLAYKTDNISFAFQSDEYNGKTIDSRTQTPRPIRTRQYQSLTQAERENTLARIYLGIHWRIDQEEGELLGRRVAQHVFSKFP